MLIFGYWVKTIPADCRFAAILPVKTEWQEGSPTHRWPATFRHPQWPWIGSHNPISKFWDPPIFWKWKWIKLLFKIGTWRVHENPHNLHAHCALASYKATSPINALSKYWPCFRTQRSTKFKPNLAHSRLRRAELLTSALISKLEGQCHSGLHLPGGDILWWLHYRPHSLLINA